jgi:hypothetical protein
MSSNQEVMDSEIFNSMQSGTPFATYRKTIPAKVYVTVLNPFNQKAEGIILYGNPKEDETARIDIWNEALDLSFRRLNKKHFDEGTLIKIIKEVPVEKHNIEQYSDSELLETLSYKYYSLTKVVNDIKTVPVLLRMIEIAREEEKSEKIIKMIEARLSKLQLDDTSVSTK